MEQETPTDMETNQTLDLVSQMDSDNPIDNGTDSDAKTDDATDSEAPSKMDICGETHRNFEYKRSEECATNFTSEKETDTVSLNSVSIKSEIVVSPIELEPASTIPNSVEDPKQDQPKCVKLEPEEKLSNQFSLSTNNLSLIRCQQEQLQSEFQTVTHKRPQQEKTETAVEPVSKPEIPNIESTVPTKLTNGHGHGSRHSSDKSASHSDDKTSHRSHDPNKSSSRHRDRDRHRPKRANIGIQCRRDKNLEKTVGFSSPLVTSETAAAASSSNPEATPVAAREGSELVCNPRFGGFSMANPCYNLGGKYRCAILQNYLKYSGDFNGGC